MTDESGSNTQTALSRILGKTVLPTLVGIGLIFVTTHADAGDLTVVSEPPMARVLNDLRPQIEHLTQRRLVVKFTAPGRFARAQSGDEPFDAVVVYKPDALALLQSNHLVDHLYCIGWTRQVLGSERTPIYAAVSRQTTERDAAQRLVAFLTSFQGLMALTAHGVDGTPNE